LIAKDEQFIAARKKKFTAWLRSHRQLILKWQVDTAVINELVEDYATRFDSTFESNIRNVLVGVAYLCAGWTYLRGRNQDFSSVRQIVLEPLESLISAASGKNHAASQLGLLQGITQFDYRKALSESAQINERTVTEDDARAPYEDALWDAAISARLLIGTNENSLRHKRYEFLRKLTYEFIEVAEMNSMPDSCIEAVKNEIDQLLEKATHHEMASGFTSIFASSMNCMHTQRYALERVVELDLLSEEYRSSKVAWPGAKPKGENNFSCYLFWMFMGFLAHSIGGLSENHRHVLVLLDEAMHQRHSHYPKIAKCPNQFIDLLQIENLEQFSKENLEPFSGYMCDLMNQNGLKQFVGILVGIVSYSSFSPDTYNEEEAGIRLDRLLNEYGVLINILSARMQVKNALECHRATLRKLPESAVFSRHAETLTADWNEEERPSNAELVCRLIWEYVGYIGYVNGGFNDDCQRVLEELDSQMQHLHRHNDNFGECRLFTALRATDLKQFKHEEYVREYVNLLLCKCHEVGSNERVAILLCLATTLIRLSDLDDSNSMEAFEKVVVILPPDKGILGSAADLVHGIMDDVSERLGHLPLGNAQLVHGVMGFFNKKSEKRVEQDDRLSVHADSAAWKVLRYSKSLTANSPGTTSSQTVTIDQGADIPCPFCCELIKPKAILCKHCKSSLKDLQVQMESPGVG
jgi:hypothetical protein